MNKPSFKSGLLIHVKFEVFFYTELTRLLATSSSVKREKLEFECEWLYLLFSKEKQA